MSTQITASPKIYIGLDIHKKTWTVSIQTELFFHKTYSMPSKSSDLYDYVEKNFPNHEVIPNTNIIWSNLHSWIFFTTFGLYYNSDYGRYKKIDY
jgi:hypothetical protein